MKIEIEEARFVELFDNAKAYDNCKKCCDGCAAKRYNEILEKQIAQVKDSYKSYKEAVELTLQEEPAKKLCDEYEQVKKLINLLEDTVEEKNEDYFEKIETMRGIIREYRKGKIIK